jgi:hypothetical protein
MTTHDNARIVVLPATAAVEVRVVDRPSNKCEAQGRFESLRQIEFR